MTEIELLSPAGDLKTGIEAINSGADAVYIGASQFGARYKVSNKLPDLEKLINYAHKFNVKIYITLNTILFDNELSKAKLLIYDLYNIGADALIIQDVGLLELDLPPIPFFASTQMHNYSLEKIIFLEKVGFKRVMLARELSLEQIKIIKQNTTIELECFIHGSLCVSFSGQCYFSQALTNQSGNKGKCTQPCRMKYNLIDKNGKTLIKNGHVLSLKDLNLSENINDLIEVGVTSFKIEGRLKDQAYISNTAAFYRNKIDTYISNNSNYKRSSVGKSTTFFEPDLSKTFNRDFTKYFLFGRQKKIFSPFTQKSIGEPIGIVKKITDSYLTFELKTCLNNGDGICFFTEENVLIGTRVNLVKEEKIFLDKMENIKIKTQIFRNHDSKLEKTIQKNRSYRKIDVDILFKEIESGFLIQAKSEDNYYVSKEIIMDKILSENHIQSYNVLKTQLCKSGDTIYSICNVEIEINQAYFFQIGFLNRIRRDILEELDNCRSANYKKSYSVFEKNDFPYPEKELNYKVNVSNQKAKEFYQRHGSIIKENAFELQNNVEGKTVMVMKHCLKWELDMCKNDRNDQDNTSNEPWYLENNRNKYKIYFDCNKCEMHLIL